VSRGSSRTAGRAPTPTRQTKSHVHSTYFTPGRQVRGRLRPRPRPDLHLPDRPGGRRAGPGPPPFIASAPGRARATSPSDGMESMPTPSTSSTARSSPTNFRPRTAASPAPVGLGLAPGIHGGRDGGRGPGPPERAIRLRIGTRSDTIAVFAVDGATGALSPVEIVPCGGKGPEELLASHRTGLARLRPPGLQTRSARSGSMDRRGRLQPGPGTVSVPMPVCVLFLD
jgi:hypothetical protein